MDNEVTDGLVVITEGTAMNRADIEFAARNTRESIKVARELGDKQSVRGLNELLTYICGEAERQAGQEEVSLAEADPEPEAGDWF